MPGNSTRKSTISCCPGPAGGHGVLFPGIVDLVDCALGPPSLSQGTSFAVSDETVSFPPRSTTCSILISAQAPSNRPHKDFDSLLVKSLLLACSRSSEETHASAMEADRPSGQRESLCSACVLTMSVLKGQWALRRCDCRKSLVVDVETEGGWRRMTRADVLWNDVSTRFSAGGLACLHLS